MRDDDGPVRPKSLREMASDARPGDRWPWEPPAPEPGPDGGVREPRKPLPTVDADAADLPAAGED